MFIKLWTSSDIYSLVTEISFPTVDLFTLHPIFQSSTISLLFGTWSKNNWKVSIGAPAKIASRVEFHPQCVQKPPMDEWHKTFSWSHHCTTPLPTPYHHNSLSTEKLLHEPPTRNEHHNYAARQQFHPFGCLRLKGKFPTRCTRQNL